MTVPIYTAQKKSLLGVECPAGYREINGGCFPIPVIPNIHQHQIQSQNQTNENGQVSTNVPPIVIAPETGYGPNPVNPPVMQTSGIPQWMIYLGIGLLAYTVIKK